ncbi:MAG: COX15/CtaA family protein [Crocinitomicaceae bacterium]|nr:COX15/CtaA family protein [Crocinitomicaceae bacterium]
MNIVLIYLVILAGSVVRTSGAGMGCPDWPKCFDCWIPPTDVSQLPENYKEIYAEKRAEKIEKFTKLLRSLGMDAKADELLSDPEILKEEDFNARKTWTEYINRLSGFLAGNGVLLMVILALAKFRVRRDTIWLSLITLILLVYTAWLGSVVVATNLVPWTITAHMFPAFAIIGLLIILYYRLQAPQKLYGDSKLKWLFIVFGILTMIQVYLGTRVRQEIDTLSSSDIIRAAWVDNLDMNFYLHRSFSWLILILLGITWYLFQKKAYPKKQLILLSVLIGIEIFTGIIMAYLDVPAFSQPMHLLMSTLIFGQLFRLYLFTGSKQTSVA